MHCHADRSSNRGLIAEFVLFRSLLQDVDGHSHPWLCKCIYTHTNCAFILWTNAGLRVKETRAPKGFLQKNVDFEQSTS